MMTEFSLQGHWNGHSTTGINITTRTHKNRQFLQSKGETLTYHRKEQSETMWKLK
jgi:hypothetical protein